MEFRKKTMRAGVRNQIGNPSLNQKTSSMASITSLALILGLLGTAHPAAAQSWTQASTPNNTSGWWTVASSADGTKSVVVTSPGLIYLSTNSGASWTTASAPNLSWNGVASSADGTKLAATVANFPGIYTSSDSGITWISNNVPNLYWFSIASSADGNKLAAVAEVASARYTGPIYTSSNSGSTWTLTTAPSNVWISVASSADGSKLAAVYPVPGGIYTSTNSGLTWRSNNVPQFFWYSIASSADGMKLVAASQSPGNAIYTSTNGGLGWIQQSNAPNVAWASVASSADGTKLVAAPNGGYLYTSTNSGLTWSTNNPSEYWHSVASSADGGNLVAVNYVNPNTSIYFWQSVYKPALSVKSTSKSLVLSWPVSSTNFTLQQSTNLISWSNVTNQPNLNLTNLQNQVLLTPPGQSGLYRLKTP